MSFNYLVKSTKNLCNFGVLSISEHHLILFSLNIFGRSSWCSFILSISWQYINCAKVFFTFLVFNLFSTINFYLYLLIDNVLFSSKNS